MSRYKIDVLEYLKQCGYSQHKMNADNILSSSITSKIRKGEIVTNPNFLNTVCKLTGLEVSDIIEYIPD